MTSTVAQAVPTLATAPEAKRVETVFLDRDGVINENRSDHVKSWSEFRFLPGSADAIRRLYGAGFRVFVVTNQAIIGRGLVPHHTVDQINGMMLQELDEQGARVEAVAYCPHRPEADCACRKPRPGLLRKLALRFGLNLKRSVLIGDALSDVEAGRAVGCWTILVQSGRGREQLQHALAAGQQGFDVADDLTAATDLVLRRTAQSRRDSMASLALGGSLARRRRTRRTRRRVHLVES